MAMIVFSQMDEHNGKGVVTRYLFQNVRAWIGSIRDPKGLRATRRNFPKALLVRVFTCLGPVTYSPVTLQIRRSGVFPRRTRSNAFSEIP